MRVLFIGGNGNISWNCTQAALAAGHEVWVLNRGLSTALRRPLPSEARLLKADMRNPDSVKALLKTQTFDCITDFICFTPEQAATDISLFSGLTRQFIFISSASAYQKPLSSVPIVESTPLRNPWWEYARNKIACEDLFFHAYRSEGFPITVVRPSHTYDTIIPAAMGSTGWTISQRMLEGKPTVLHGDGNTLWTLTHAEDFARAFVGLLGHSAALGHAFHITSDEWLTWRQISSQVAEALGAPVPRFVCVPSDLIFKRNPTLGASLLGDKAWCAIFDNSKIKQFVPGWRARIPFRQGIKHTLELFLSDPGRRQVDERLNQFLDGLCLDFG